MGPLVSDTQRKRVETYIRTGIKEGGELVSGGKRPLIAGGEGGFFLEPTVIFTRNHDSVIVKEEIFGPVFTLLPFSEFEEVVQKSNDVIYGLVASIWTGNVRRALNATKDLRFGTVWVNDHLPVPS